MSVGSRPTSWCHPSRIKAEISWVNQFGQQGHLDSRGVEAERGVDNSYVLPEPSMMFRSTEGGVPAPPVMMPPTGPEPVPQPDPFFEAGKEDPWGYCNMAAGSGGRQPPPAPPPSGSPNGGDSSQPSRPAGGEMFPAGRLEFFEN